jgi:predicted metal-dependent hydrolase
MFDVTVMFNVEIGLNIRDFFRQDAINKPAFWARLLKYLFVTPGLFRNTAAAYLAYYLPGFHPWRIDDRELLGAVRDELAAA